MILTHGTGIYRKRRMQRKQREEGHDLHDKGVPRDLGEIRESVGRSVSQSVSQSEGLRMGGSWS
jgi:hypothetical protein